MTPAQRKLKALYASLGIDARGLFGAEPRKPAKPKAQKKSPAVRMETPSSRHTRRAAPARKTRSEYFAPPRAPEPPLEPVFKPTPSALPTPTWRKHNEDVPQLPPVVLRDGEQLEHHLEARKPHAPSEPAKLDRATELAASVAAEKAAAAAAAEARRAEVDAKAKWRGTRKASGGGRKCKLPAHGANVEHRDERGTFRIAGPSTERELDVAAWRSTG